MPDVIPLTPSDSNYELRIPLDDENFRLLVRWNTRDLAFYMDIREADGSPIALGLKLVLGVNIGRHSTHPFFGEHVLRLADSSGQKLDAGFDDLNRRVYLLHMSRKEIVEIDGLVKL